MSVQLIQPTDKLNSGFRAKYNETANEVITGFTDNGDGTATANQFGSGGLPLDLRGSYFTKQEVIDLLASYVPGRQPIEYEYTEADLVEEGSGDGNFYLPYKRPDGSPVPDGVMPYNIIFTYEDPDNPGEFLTNSVPVSAFTNNSQWTEGRIYGFSNIPQTITIFAI